MRRTVSFTCLLLAVTSVEGQQPAPDKSVHAPRPDPDRISLTWRKDPARTQSMTWRTDTTVVRGVVEFKGNSGFDEAKQANALTTVYQSDQGEAHFHSAHLEGLTPDTRYDYRVGDGARWSEWSPFRTASDKPARFSFLYFGDAQCEYKERWAPLVQAALKSAPHARFALHAGDLVNAGDSDAEWGDWFQAAAPIHATMPIVPIPGNHEYTNSDGTGVTPYWDKQFPLPHNGPPGVRCAYYLDFQGTRIIALNCNEKLSEQVKWLRGVLKNNPQRWTIVCCHFPIYSSASGRDNPELRRILQPVYDEYRVDLVLQGHDHSYGRSELLGYDGAQGGTVYVVTVSGPRFYPINGEKWMARWGQKIQLFQVITIDGDRLQFDARTSDGELYDSFTLQKRTGGFNILTNGPHDPRSVQPVERENSPDANQSIRWVLVTLLVLLVALLVMLRRARKPRAAGDTSPRDVG